MAIDNDYFEILRSKINKRLLQLTEQGKINRNQALLQIKKYKWLYGALGCVPSKVMFICENPSVSGVERAHTNTIDGKAPDIEAQWWGSPRNPAAKRFREVLYRLGLKSTPPKERGGWKCYITNVIKQANIVKDQNNLDTCVKKEQAREWSDILQWEIDNVKPKFIFCVGGKSFSAIKMLQRENKLNIISYNRLWHYSARGSDEKIIQNILYGIKKLMSI